MLFGKIPVLWIDNIQAGLKVAAERLHGVLLLCLINSLALIFNLTGLAYNMNSKKGFFFFKFG